MRYRMTPTSYNAFMRYLTDTNSRMAVYNVETHHANNEKYIVVIMKPYYANMAAKYGQRIQ